MVCGLQWQVVLIPFSLVCYFRMIMFFVGRSHPVVIASVSRQQFGASTCDLHRGMIPPTRWFTWWRSLPLFPHAKANVLHVLWRSVSVHPCPSISLYILMLVLEHRIIPSKVSYLPLHRQPPSVQAAEAAAAAGEAAARNTAPSLVSTRRPWCPKMRS